MKTPDGHSVRAIMEDGAVLGKSYPAAGLVKFADHGPRWHQVKPGVGRNRVTPETVAAARVRVARYYLAGFVRVAGLLAAELTQDEQQQAAAIAERVRAKLARVREVADIARPVVAAIGVGGCEGVAS